MVSRRKLPDTSLSNVLNLLSIGLRYTFSFELNGLILAWSASLQFMLKGQPPKFKASVWNFPISETGYKSNSVFRHTDSNWIIIMELKRKAECSWACTFWTSLCFKGYRSLPWTWHGVRYYKLSIATGVTNTSIL